MPAASGFGPDAAESPDLSGAHDSIHGRLRAAAEPAEHHERGFLSVQAHDVFVGEVRLAGHQGLHGHQEQDFSLAERAPGGDAEGSSGILLDRKSVV